MNPSKLCIVAAAILAASAAFSAQNEPPAAAGATAEIRPADRYAELNKRVQERLRQLGYYAGPVNGDFGPETQAALAQFQRSIPLPVNGMLDRATLDALGVETPAATN